MNHPISVNAPEFMKALPVAPPFMSFWIEIGFLLGCYFMTRHSLTPLLHVARSRKKSRDAIPSLIYGLIYTLSGYAMTAVLTFATCGTLLIYLNIVAIAAIYFVFLYDVHEEHCGVRKKLFQVFDLKFAEKLARLIPQFNEKMTRERH